MLIYVLIKAKPEKLASNIAYIRDFRGNDRLNGEDEYYLTTFEAGMSFLQNLRPIDLKIDVQEYHRLYNIYSEKAKAKMKE